MNPFPKSLIAALAFGALSIATLGQCQLAKLTASDAAFDDRFGDSVAATSRLSLVGALFDDAANQNSGSAWIFEQSSARVWAGTHIIPPEFAGLFGRAAAIGEGLAVFGSDARAYLFQESGD